MDESLSFYIYHFQIHAWTFKSSFQYEEAYKIGLIFVSVSSPHFSILGINLEFAQEAFQITIRADQLRVKNSDSLLNM